MFRASLLAIRQVFPAYSGDLGERLAYFAPITGSYDIHDAKSIIVNVNNKQYSGRSFTIFTIEPQLSCLYQSSKH